MIKYLLLAMLLSACSSNNLVMAPDTQTGEQLKPEYMVGKWCTNRELTAQSNKDAGFSALTNLAQHYWLFNKKGEWQDSVSGWLYAKIGKWRLEGLDSLILERSGATAVPRQATFKNDGQDLYLVEEDGEFLVLSRCD